LFRDEQFSSASSITDCVETSDNKDIICGCALHFFVEDKEEWQESV